MRKQDGMILVVVMVFTSIITMIALVILELVNVEYKLNADFIRYEKAFVQARFGLNLATRKIQNRCEKPFYYESTHLHYSVQIIKKHDHLFYELLSSGLFGSTQLHFKSVYSCTVKLNSNCCDKEGVIKKYTIFY